jgi:hypothetical protein
MDRGRRWRRHGIVALVMLASSASTGCVKRRYTIRTDVPGTLVYVNGEEIGTAPASKSFTYYGDREVTLVADGYQTQKVLQPVKAPWWDNGLTDFFTENLLPVTLRDEREFQYRMVPATNPPTNELLGRAQALKQEGLAPPPPKRRTLLQALGFR